MGYSATEYSKIYNEVKQALPPNTSDTIIAAIINEMGRDRRQQAIHDERLGGRPSERNMAPKTVESVKARLGSVANLVTVEQAGNEVRITLHTGLNPDEFRTAKDTIKALGARYVSQSRMWIL